MLTSICNAINSGQYEQATSLVDPIGGASLFIGKRKEQNSLLHYLAQARNINDSLSDPGNNDYASALALIEKVCNKISTGIKEKTSGRIPLFVALYFSYNHTATVLFNRMKKDSPKEITSSFDKQKWSTIHYCIQSMNVDLLGETIEMDEEHKLLKQAAKGNLTPLALAVRCCRDNPTVIPFSILNEVFFSLDPRERSEAVEVELRMDKGIQVLSRPLWEYALDYALERDENGRPVRCNAFWLDLMKQIVDGKNLTVMGLLVDVSLICQYAPSREIYRRAFNNLSVHVKQRTANLITANRLLARHAELTRLLQDPGKPWALSRITEDPSEMKPADLNPTLSNQSDHVLLFKQTAEDGTEQNRLFFAYMPSANQWAVKEISYENLEVGYEKDAFNQLVAQFPLENNSTASEEQLKSIRILKQTTPIGPAAGNSEMRAMRTAMTLFKKKSEEHAGPRNQASQPNEEKKEGEEEAVFSGTRPGFSPAGSEDEN